MLRLFLPIRAMGFLYIRIHFSVFVQMEIMYTV